MKHVTAAIIKKENKYLICQRSTDDEYNLLWEFPGGKLEAGETLEECIIREIREELELNIKAQSVFTTSVYHYDNKDIYFIVYNAIIVGGKMKLNVHNDARWVELKELQQYNFMPADIEFVDRLIKEYTP